MKARGKFVSLLLLFLLAITVTTQVQAQERRVIPVSVVDKDGNIVEGLTAKNFRGKFRGKGVEVISAVRHTLPQRISILVDASPSVAEHRYLHPAAWRLAYEAFVAFSNNQQVKLFVVTDHVQSYSVPTGTREQVYDFMQGLSETYREEKQPRMSPIVDALSAVSEGFGSVQVGDAILLLSDGLNNQSEVKNRQLRDVLARFGVRLFVACLPVYPPNGGVLASFRPLCGELPELSGGEVIHLSYEERRPGRVERMARQARRLYPILRGLYKVEVELPRQVDKPRKWKLEVVDERGKKMKGVKVYYPRLLVPLEEEPKQ